VFTNTDMTDTQASDVCLYLYDTLPEDLRPFLQLPPELFVKLMEYRSLIHSKELLTSRYVTDTNN